MEYEQPGIGPATKRKPYSQSHCTDTFDKSVSAGSCQTVLRKKIIRNVVVTIPLERIIVDKSVVRGIACWRNSAMIANTVDYYYEIEDNGLLPLDRMERMMAEDRNVRPPISVRRVGGAYVVDNGRHRLARAHLLGEKSIDAVVKHTGHEDFVRDGGESNPGPTDLEMTSWKSPGRAQRPQRRKYRKGCKKSFVPKDQVSAIVDQVCADIRPTTSHSDCDDSLHHSAPKQNRKGGSRNEKGRRRDDRGGGVPLVSPIFSKEINSDSLAELIATWENIKPTRETLDTWVHVMKCQYWYDCACGKKTHGFPKCGCEVLDQVKCLYNKIVAIEGELVEETGIRIVIKDKIVKGQTQSVVKVNKGPTLDLDSIEVATTPQPKTPEAVPVTKIVRERRGIYKYLKRPGFFSMTDNFNHHHESIAKIKDQSKHNMMVIPDECINDALYAYLRRNEYDAYPDRKTKLAHMVRLAAKWDQGLFKLNDQGKNLDALALNKYFITIQKVTDAKDTSFLLQEVNAYHSNTSSKIHRLLGIFGCVPKVHRLGRLN